MNQPRTRSEMWVGLLEKLGWNGGIAPRSKEGQFRNQDNTKKKGNNEDKSSKAMFAIDGVDNSKENFEESMVAEQVSQDTSSFVESSPKVDKEIAFPVNKKMCDKKNYALFTDIECLVLSPNFKLPDENQILLKIPRKDNMYSFDMKNIVPKESLTCLVAKATLDESMLCTEYWFY
ncbi:hypothetical protein Tco_0096891 [Tanacetum coccineum]